MTDFKPKELRDTPSVDSGFFTRWVDEYAMDGFNEKDVLWEDLKKHTTENFSRIQLQVRIYLPISTQVFLGIKSISK